MVKKIEYERAKWAMIVGNYFMRRCESEKSRHFCLKNTLNLFSSFSISFDLERSSKFHAQFRVYASTHHRQWCKFPSDVVLSIFVVAMISVISCAQLILH